jgi:hypothetical protein
MATWFWSESSLTKCFAKLVSGSGGHQPVDSQKRAPRGWLAEKSTVARRGVTPLVADAAAKSQLPSNSATLLVGIRKTGDLTVTSGTTLSDTSEVLRMRNIVVWGSRISSFKV